MLHAPLSPRRAIEVLSATLTTTRSSSSKQHITVHQRPPVRQWPTDTLIRLSASLHLVLRRWACTDQHKQPNFKAEALPCRRQLGYRSPREMWSLAQSPLLLRLDAMGKKDTRTEQT